MKITKKVLAEALSKTDFAVRANYQSAEFIARQYERNYSLAQLKEKVRRRRTQVIQDTTGQYFDVDLNVLPNV